MSEKDEKSNALEGAIARPLTDTDLDSLEKLLSGAAPTPWIAQGGYLYLGVDPDDDPKTGWVWFYGRSDGKGGYGDGDPESAAATAALRNLAPALLAEIRAARAWRREAEGLLREIEWRGEAGDWDEGGCPMCLGPEPFGEGKKYGGHEKDCRLGAFLGEGTKGP